MFAALWNDPFCLQKRYLVHNLVSRNLKVKYHRSFLGLFWTVLVPTCLASIYYVVFHFVLRVDAPHYFFQVLVGIMPWSFFAAAVQEGVTAILSGANLLNKIYLPAKIFPFVSTLTHFVHLLAALPLIILVYAFSDVPHTVEAWPEALAILGCLFIFTYSTVLILSALFIYLRDLGQLVVIGLQALFYLTPILYGPSRVPEAYRHWLWLNPLAGYFIGLQNALVQGVSPSPLDALRMAITTGGFFFVALVLHEFLAEDIVEAL